MAQAVGDIVNGMYDGSQTSARSAMERLRQYADIISPWAETVAARMVDDLVRHEARQWAAASRSDQTGRRQASQHTADSIKRGQKKQWYPLSRDISAGLRHQMQNTAIGQVARSIIEQNIQWMKSIPLHAADRIEEIQSQAIDAMIHGERPIALMEAILRTGDVAKSRARLIARTEIARATQALTQARATAIGSEGYIWRTAHDPDVRHSHAHMEGKFVRWENPPTLDGMTGHAGTLPNCRCYCDVVIPEN